MDTVQVMKKLRALMNIHDKTITQIVQLDEYIIGNNRQLVKVVQMKKTNEAIKMMHRKTTAENVRQMFKHYQQTKWAEILQVANQIMSNMQLSGSSSNHMEPYNDMQPEVDSIIQRVRRINRLAMVQMCEFNRYG